MTRKSRCDGEMNGKIIGIEIDGPFTDMKHNSKGKSEAGR